MNYLVFLDTQAGALEKILSGTKSMLLVDADPACGTAPTIVPGDSLYFLRNKSDCDLRVKATVRRVQTYTNQVDEGLSRILKEKQPKLQLTEEQFNDWSLKGHVLFIELHYAHKIEAIHVASNKITNRTGWIPFEELDQIT